MTESDRKRRKARIKRQAEQYLGRKLPSNYWKHVERVYYNELQEPEDLEWFEEDFSPGSRYLRALMFAVGPAEQPAVELPSGEAVEPAYVRPGIIDRQVYLVRYVAARTTAITLLNLASRSFMPRGRICWLELCYEWNQQHPLPQYTQRSMDKAFRRAIANPLVRERYFELMQEEEAKALRWIAGTPSGDLEPGCQWADFEAAAQRFANLYYFFDLEAEVGADEYDALEASLAGPRIKKVGEEFAAAMRFYAWWWAKTRSTEADTILFPVFHPEPSWIVRMREILRPEWERMNQSASSGGNGRESNERQH